MSSGQGAVENPIERWVLLTGSRTALVAVLCLGIVALTAALTYWDLLYVGTGSNLSTALSSGLLSGLLTLITVTLSINQLILSRVFGAPADLTDTVEGNVEFRETVEAILDVPASPNEPDEFLGLVGEGLDDLGERLREQFDGTGTLTSEFESFVESVTDYGDHIATAGETDDQFEVLVIALGTGYAENLMDARRLRASADDLPGDADETLGKIVTLLEAIATMRQFFKTLVLQQDLARFSRRLIYTGLAAVLTTYYLSQVYTAASGVPTTIPGAYMPWVMSVAAGVIFSPLVVIVAYLLRIATVTLYTVSVGSFVPPLKSIEEQ